MKGRPAGEAVARRKPSSEARSVAPGLSRRAGAVEHPGCASMEARIDFNGSPSAVAHGRATPVRACGPAGGRLAGARGVRRSGDARGQTVSEIPSRGWTVSEQFDWLDQWYPFAPVCDLDPDAPHGKTVLGLDVVAWYDRAAGEWRVFADACPHRLAPLSEGLINGKGRLRCVYHGWCFDGAGDCKFIRQAPALGSPVHSNPKACVASYPLRRAEQDPVTKEQQGKKKAPRFMLVVFCVPVAPDRSRLIWAFPRNFVVWLDMIIPRWFYHINQNSVLDSDAYILHVEERKFAASGLDNWQKDCYVPTARIVRHHGRCLQELVQEVLQESGWLGNPAARPIAANPYEGWSLGECTSCSTALKAMRVLEVALQVVSVAVVGFLAVAKETLVTSAVNRAVVVTMAVLCFAASRWLSNFIEKNFYFQDYSHAYK
ncbi:unnamed protein product [Urochloa decumbens]|uniref:Rieske domain-containing protein n=1 Tax=Urochloa decumbens TaxID=240449 RepID=A0ABC8X3Y9_9POAL